MCTIFIGLICANLMMNYAPLAGIVTHSHLIMPCFMMNYAPLAGIVTNKIRQFRVANGDELRAPCGDCNLETFIGCTVAVLG